MEEKTTLNVEGMTCSNCALGVSRFLEKKGLSDVRVDFSSGEVTFDHIPDEDLPKVISGIHQLGYHVKDTTANPVADPGKPFYKKLEFRFLLCAILTAPLLMHMFIGWHILHNPWFQLIVATPVFIIGMLYFGKSAFHSLKTGIPNMDLLITIGSSAAFVYSLAGMYLHSESGNVNNYLFFETSATIITLVMLGNIIEQRSVKRTTSALRELIAMQPEKANKITISKDHQETIQPVPIDEIRKDDAVLINTGDAIPIDGTIYWGQITADESALTGESMPVEKGNGDRVLAGAIAVSGSAKVVTDKAGKSTVLSNIIRLVKEAQQAKPEIQKLGDKVSAWFVPAVILLSVIAFITGLVLFDLPVNGAMMNAIAVLVISCPCAMGLATPTAVAVGLGKAAGKGILVKGGSTLEQFNNIATAVFDKTGTLTTGNFKISEINTLGTSEDHVIDLIYSLEQHSSHPIAKSLLKELESRKSAIVSFKNVKEIRGIGLEAIDEAGNKLVLGSANSINETPVDSNHSLYLTRNDQLIATLDLKDEIKRGASEMIREVKSAGIEPVLLSGDNPYRCKLIADQLGIDTVFAGKLPDEKAKIITDLKKKGKLIMVGDGINDAPSLALADIGISFGEATKIAINSAQVILLNNNDLSAIPEAIKIGKLTLKTIKQNLFWAFAYNIVAIPVAGIGLLSPMVAALSMAFSDVIVIGNSIRLKFKSD